MTSKISKTLVCLAALFVASIGWLGYRYFERWKADNSKLEEVSRKNLSFLQKFSEVSSEKRRTYKILTLYSAIPELEWIKRIERACKNLGWECSSAFCGDFSIEQPSLSCKPVNPLEIAELIDQIKPDLTISMWDNKIFSNRCPNYLCVYTS